MVNEGHEYWPEGPSDASWIELREEDLLTVGDFVPEAFDAFARIFHPLKVARKGMLKWSEVAALFGGTVHPHVHLPELLGIDDSRTSAIRAKGVIVTNQLPDDEWEALGAILKRHTASPVFLAGISDTWGSSDIPDEAKSQELLKLPYRSYYLVEVSFDYWADSVARRYPANLYWPKDRTWFMNTDVDAASSYIGGTREAITDILRSPLLETAEAHPDDSVVLY